MTANNAPTQTIRVSASEIEAQALKAVRGHGCPWGVAEDAGKSVRWLAIHALPSVDMLADVLRLQAVGDTPTATTCCVRKEASCRAGCPLLMAAALADRSRELKDGDTLTIAPTRAPWLLIAAAGRLAIATAMVLEVRLAGTHGRAVISPQGVLIDDTTNDVLSRSTSADAGRIQSVHIAPLDAQGQAEPNTFATPAMGSRSVDAAAWAVLGTLAHRTYVPANDASRASGAGAGLSDND